MIQIEMVNQQSWIKVNNHLGGFIFVAVWFAETAPGVDVGSWLRILAGKQVRANSIP